MNRSERKLDRPLKVLQLRNIVFIFLLICREIALHINGSLVEYKNDAALNHGDDDADD